MEHASPLGLQASLPLFYIIIETCHFSLIVFTIIRFLSMVFPLDGGRKMCPLARECPVSFLSFGSTWACSVTCCKSNSTTTGSRKILKFLSSNVFMEESDMMYEICSKNTSAIKWGERKQAWQVTVEAG